MILKKIRLENIRSYEELELEFPSGSVLLSGDIGSGKTSILLALEFALFGLQPGQKGSSLLRYGQDSGRVIAELEIDNQLVIIERGLKKSGKSIAQESASITIAGEKKDLSVTELKNLILGLLNYPPEFVKKTNLLYKFTVYIPQEGMKQIILESADTRLDTLRHIFGIDKYKRINENCNILITKIREEIRAKESLFLDIEEKKQNKKQKGLEREDAAEKIKQAAFERDRIKIEKKEVETLMKGIEEKITLKNTTERDIEKSNILLATKKNELSSNSKEISRISEQIKDITGINFSEDAVKLTETEIADRKKQIQELDKKILELSSTISALKIQNNDSETTKLRVYNMKLCPTCLQDVNESHKSSIKLKYEQEVVENNKRIISESEKLNLLMSNKKNTNSEFEKLEKTRQELNILRVKLESAREKQEKIKELEKSNLTIQADALMIEKHIENLRLSLAELEKFDSIYEEQKKRFDEISRNERLVEIKFAELNKDLKFLELQISTLEKEIAEKELVKEKAIYLKELEDWINDSFLPLISFTEKNVMLKLREEFSRLFSDWFSVLVSESLTVRIDEEFSPIIEQQGYELEYSFLSGGERTAVALAYRLALNQVINSLLSKIKTKDFLILDEPTDGFSEQQLDKMRDVLQQLNVKQLILVSHEQKIEGFVENIIRLKKQQGVTSVSAP